MAEEVVLKNDSAILRYHPDGIVHHEFLKRMVGKDFRDVLERGLAKLIQTSATKWLSDDRKNSVFNAEDDQWAQTDWFPRATRTSWKYWAIVNPEKAAGRLQMARTAKYSEIGGVQVAFFSTPEEALAWLRSVGARVNQTG